MSGEIVGAVKTYSLKLLNCTLAETDGGTDMSLMAPVPTQVIAHLPPGEPHGFFGDFEIPLHDLIVSS